MNLLEQLTPDQKVFIASMPYRVGLWMSYSDQTGGMEADVKEKIALENILHGFAGQVFGSELLQYVMQATIDHQEKWNEWGDNLEEFPDQAKRSCEILSEYFDKKEVTAYAIRLMEIAEAVALAFREQKDLSAIDMLKLRIEYFLSGLKTRGLPQKSFEQFLNISKDERTALGRLADALGRPRTI